MAPMAPTPPKHNTISNRRYKIVLKDENGKVVQIHECYRLSVTKIVLEKLDRGYRVTVTELTT